MDDDSELLRRYADTRAEEAFAELVRRHVDLVHSAALRQTNGDVQLAEDVTQVVFGDLARKAAEVSRHRVLAGWLFVSTRYAAAKIVRAEQRRRAREQEAHTMNELNGGTANPIDWARVRPVLDEAMGELGETDRAAILLRFFEGRPFAEVGARLQLNENSARMRVERAIAKLHGLLARRGVTSTTGALAVALAEQAVTAAPAGLAASVTGAALAGGAGTAASVATFMGFTKLQLGLTGALVVAGAGGWTVQHQAAEKLGRDVAVLRVDEGELAALRADNEALARAAAAVRRGRDDAAEAERLRDEVATLARQVDERVRAAEAARRTEEAAARERAARALQIAARRASPDQVPQLSGPQSPPVYPAALRAAGVEGKVLVEFVVGADGNAHDVLALESTHPEFATAAVEAVKRWKFLPGVKGQRAVNTQMHQLIAFNLAGNDGARGADVVEHSDSFWPQ